MLTPKVNMAHLTAEFHIRFAVEMKGRIAFAQLRHAIYIGTNQIFHADVTVAGTIA